MEESSEEIVKLNVGGTVFVTTKTTLCIESESLFSKMFSNESSMKPSHKIEGAFFLDRDPVYFRVILNFLRSGKIERGFHFSIFRLYFFLKLN